MVGRVRYLVGIRSSDVLLGAGGVGRDDGVTELARIAQPQLRLTLA